MEPDRMTFYKLTLSLLIVTMSGLSNTTSVAVASPNLSLMESNAKYTNWSAPSFTPPASENVAGALTFFMHPERLFDSTLAGVSAFAITDSDENGFPNGYRVVAGDGAIFKAFPFGKRAGVQFVDSPAATKQLSQPEQATKLKTAPSTAPAPAILALLSIGLLCLSLHLRLVARRTSVLAHKAGTL